MSEEWEIHFRILCELNTWDIVFSCTTMCWDILVCYVQIQVQSKFYIKCCTKYAF